MLNLLICKTINCSTINNRATNNIKKNVKKKSDREMVQYRINLYKAFNKIIC